MVLTLASRMAVWVKPSIVGAVPVHPPRSIATKKVVGMKTNDGKVIAIKKVVAIKTVYEKLYKNDCSPPFSFITIQDFLVLLMHSFCNKNLVFLPF